MVYDNGTRDVPMEAYVSFWVVPWRVLGILLLILLFVGIGLLSTFKKWIRLFRRIKNGRSKDEHKD
jgi:hypothetical protein